MPHMPAWGTLLHKRRIVLASSVVAIAAVAIAILALIILSAPAAPPVGVAPATPSHTPSPEATTSPTDVRGDETSGPTITPTASPSPAADVPDRYTVLVLGSDSDSTRRARGKGFLTDAITVVSVAGDGSDVALFSLPRDSSDLPMPDGTIWSGKANSIAPRLGPAAMRDAMSVLLGIPIDRYVMLDMDDFRHLIDAAGGVTVDVPYPLTDKRCTIGAGAQHLNGALALCYARHRAIDTDYARAGRHQQLLLAIRERILAGTLNPAGLFGAFGSLQTDLSTQELPMLMELAVRSATAEVRNVVFGPEYMRFAGLAGARGWISVPDVGAIRATVSATLQQGDDSVSAPTADHRRHRTPSDLKVE